jgi:hypothetical protein
VVETRENTSFALYSLRHEDKYIFNFIFTNRFSNIFSSIFHGLFNNKFDIIQGVS